MGLDQGAVSLDESCDLVTSLSDIGSGAVSPRRKPIRGRGDDSGPLGSSGRPTMLAPMQTPASNETGVRIGFVAGARFGPDSEQLPVVNAHWRYQGAKHAERVMVRVGVIP